MDYGGGWAAAGKGGDGGDEGSSGRGVTKNEAITSLLEERAKPRLLQSNIFLFPRRKKQEKVHLATNLLLLRRQLRTRPSFPSLPEFLTDGKNVGICFWSNIEGTSVEKGAANKHLMGSRRSRLCNVGGRSVLLPSHRGHSGEAAVSVDLSFPFLLRGVCVYRLLTAAADARGCQLSKERKLCIKLHFLDILNLY
jgi:hypothetical protein